jgi:uncharacterized protein YdeI (YjbR/CyaY-like superfamily)
MNRDTVDSYLRDGCGRCEHYRTPQCKVHLWTKPLVALRALVREAGLVEALKWGSPTYAVDGKNVLMILSFRESCALSFLQGAALTDADGILERAGPNSQFARLFRVKTADDVKRREGSLRALIDQAVAFSRAGGKVERAPAKALPEELTALLADDPTLAAAFDALTPGRKRSYALHVGGAKQSATRTRRAEACVPGILGGRGFNER